MSMNLLEKEMNEIHNYVRHNIQIFLTWYTFFITANLVGLQWFVSLPKVGQSVSFNQYLSSALGFLIVNLLGLYASHHTRKYIKSSDVRVNEIVNILATNSKYNSGTPQSPVPIKLYFKGIIAVQVSLIAMSISWLLMLFFKIF